MNHVSVVGLGAMGFALAQTLVSNGYQVILWNRTLSKAEPLVQQEATLAPSVAEAISASPITIICVTDYEVARQILETEEVALAASGRTIVQLTTGTPEDARSGEVWARAQGAQYLDGAILAIPSQVGRTDTTILVSGSAPAFEISEPPLRVLAGHLQYMGEPVGAASAWDLACLSHLFGGVLGFYHGARILESEGIPVDALGPLMAEMAPVIGEMVRLDGEAIQSGDYSNPESSLETCWRGMELVLRQAQEAGINSEFPAFASAMFKKGMAAGYGHEKAPALIKVLRQSA